MNSALNPNFQFLIPFPLQSIEKLHSSESYDSSLSLPIAPSSLQSLLIINENNNINNNTLSTTSASFSSVSTQNSSSLLLSNLT